MRSLLADACRFGVDFGGATAGCEKKVDVCYLANVTDWGDGCVPRIAVYLLPDRCLDSEGRAAVGRAPVARWAGAQKVP